MIELAQNPAKYPGDKLHIAAALTLSKLMMISDQFCKDNLRLFFTLMMKSDNVTIRKNAIVAIGDLCVRFPNHLDPYTVHLYAPLSDPDNTVRMYGLKVIARLILSDMIKVKGNFSEVAKLVVDEDENLSSYARFFYCEMKKRALDLYNSLPDIISNLSHGERMASEEDFRAIMKFLIEFIDKEKQSLGLTEKLCSRFNEPHM